MSEQKDEILQRTFQLLVDQNAASGTLAFNINEFSRLPNDSTIQSQLTPEISQQVADALYASLTSGGYRMVANTCGSSVQFIAAQFKNVNMRESQLEPSIIETALTKIIDNLDSYPQLQTIKADLSYHDGGSMMMIVGKGVRTFCVKGKN